MEDRRSRAYPVRTSDPPISLVDRAREIEQADQALETHAHGKLEVIARQMRALKAQAEEIIEQTRRDAQLHRVRCNFEKTIGLVMHLYERDDGEAYFSLLSPEDWKGRNPHEFLGSFRLNADRSFERLVGDYKAEDDPGRARCAADGPARLSICGHSPGSGSLPR